MEALTFEQVTLIETHLHIPKIKARQYSSRNIPYEDLVQEGNIGLIKAARRYDPSFGTKFSTYANFWCKQAIIEALTNKSRTIRLPSHIVNFKLKIYKYIDKYLLTHEREPEAILIATELSIELHIVELVLGLSTENMSNYESEEQLDFGASTFDTTLDDVIEDERFEIVLEYIRGLSKKDQVVLGLKFGILHRL
jgi:RNA polymerase primary sigma factor